MAKPMRRSRSVPSASPGAARCRCRSRRSTFDVPASKSKRVQFGSDSVIEAPCGGRTRADEGKRGENDEAGSGLAQGTHCHLEHLHSRKSLTLQVTVELMRRTARIYSIIICNPPFVGKRGRQTDDRRSPTKTESQPGNAGSAKIEGRNQRSTPPTSCSRACYGRVIGFSRRYWIFVVLWCTKLGAEGRQEGLAVDNERVVLERLGRKSHDRQAVVRDRRGGRGTGRPSRTQSYANRRHRVHRGTGPLAPRVVEPECRPAIR